MNCSGLDRSFSLYGFRRLDNKNIVCILLLTSIEDIFLPIGQEYPFLQVSEIFLSRPAVSA